MEVDVRRGKCGFLSTRGCVCLAFDGGQRLGDGYD